MLDIETLARREIVLPPQNWVGALENGQWELLSSKPGADTYLVLAPTGQLITVIAEVHGSRSSLEAVEGIVGKEDFDPSSWTFLIENLNYNPNVTLQHDFARRSVQEKVAEAVDLPDLYDGLVELVKQRYISPLSATTTIALTRLNQCGHAIEMGKMDELERKLTLEIAYTEVRTILGTYGIAVDKQLLFLRLMGIITFGNAAGKKRLIDNTNTIKRVALDVSDAKQAEIVSAALQKGKSNYLILIGSGHIRSLTRSPIPGVVDIEDVNQLLQIDLEKVQLALQKPQLYF